MDRPLFSLSNVQKSRAQGPGYSLIIPHLSIMPGEKIGITGPSGCGKSTALDLLGMVLRPESAEQFLFCPESDSVDIADVWQRKGQNRLAAIRLRHVGYILQTGGLLPFLSVRDNMGLTARARNLSERASTVEHLAVRLGIERLLDTLPGRLSIGERQRVAIGRALCSRPSVILADEPTAALDPVHARVVLDLLLGEVHEMGTTLILVTHDPALVSDAGLRECRIQLEEKDNGVQAVMTG